MESLPTVFRYNWRYLQSLILFYIDQVIVEYDSQSQVEVGMRSIAYKLSTACPV